jgi:hypothetical protein
MESKRRYEDRRKRFVGSSRWALNHRNNYQIKQKSFYIEIIRDKEEFKIRINRKTGRMSFPSLLEAKIKIFDVIESGDLESYFSKIAQKL